MVENIVENKQEGEREDGEEGSEQLEEISDPNGEERDSEEELGVRDLVQREKVGVREL